MNYIFSHLNPAWITAFFVLGTQAVMFFRWIYRRMRDDEIMRCFVQDMAENHLDHIYGALRDIARSQGIELIDPPPIRWIRLKKASSDLSLFDHG